jgi:hypothetical protein
VVGLFRAIVLLVTRVVDYFRSESVACHENSLNNGDGILRERGVRSTCVNKNGHNGAILSFKKRNSFETGSLHRDFPHVAISRN